MATTKQIEECIDYVFQSQTYGRLTTSTLVQLTMHQLDLKFHAALPYGTVSQQVIEYIDIACYDKRLFKVKGKDGGIFKALPTTLPANAIELNNSLVKHACADVACRQCGKGNTIGDKKCWWCETPDPTKRV